ncbi:response regulator transcription factor [Nocardioides sp. cx-169]|uniref:response regulator transcription factor n=1 Tax=Nocardioides sp. cx-169 TaxID=2899080 RepID=UPI001E420390|nr:response regulator transcription factor [Nocardioides sp. cx-169]MCD4536322.1 response regulator transcription factor [Nocardioides sp. cx-169]
MPASRRLTRITIVEDHTLFAEALDVALTLQGYDVHRPAPSEHARPSHERLLAEILRSRPRILLLDLHLGHGLHGVPLIRPCSEAGIAVVVVTGSLDPGGWGECLVHGALTVLPKSTPLNSILATIRRIREGRTVLPREERARLVDEFRTLRKQQAESRTRLASLTAREREILAQMMEGRQVRQIAQDFVVSEATVRTQVKSILAKLGVSSQLAAVGMALRTRTPDVDTHYCGEG